MPRKEIEECNDLFQIKRKSVHYVLNKSKKIQKCLPKRRGREKERALPTKVRFMDDLKLDCDFCYSDLLSLTYCAGKGKSSSGKGKGSSYIGAF